MALDMTYNTVIEKIGAPLLSNRFYGDFPALGDDQEGELSYFLQSTETPSKSIGEIIINWQGLQYKVPGDVTYDAWTATFICDKSQSAYKYISLWMDLIVDVQTNSKGTLDVAKRSIDLHQLDGNGQIITTWYCKGMFPTNITGVSFDRDAADTVSQFTVTFAMDYHSLKSI